MKDNNNLKKDHKLDVKPISKRRRSFAKAGVVAPVFLTLLNRPAWGAGRSLCTVSGFNSMGVQPGITSGVADPDICSGITATATWESALLTVDQDFGFHEAFGIAPIVSIPDGTSGTIKVPKFSDVLAYSGTALGNPDKNKKFIGLYLDAAAASSGSFPLGTPADVVVIFKTGNSPIFPSEWTDLNVEDFISYLLSHASS